MEYVIVGPHNGGLVVAVKCSWLGDWNVEVLKKMLKPDNVSYYYDKSSILRFSGRAGYSGLLLYFPGYESGAKEQTVTCSRLASVNIAGPIRINASDIQDRKSTTGFCIFLGNALISWSVNKQSIVARSSSEAEYKSLAVAAVDLIWVCRLCADFSMPLQSTSLYCDNISAMKYGLDDNTVDFIGHALALHTNDDYLDKPAIDTVKRMKLYADSLARFQGGSPYIYPQYGLGELPQGFARLSAVYGGTYMLNKPECKVEFDQNGKAYGVTSEGETAKCKKVVCDPSYLPDKVKKVGRVTRAICIMSHPITDTNNSDSVQIILPQKQLGRKSDMYVFCCSYSHNIAPEGKYIAFVSTEAETDRPEVELKPGMDLLGPVDETFFDIYDRYEPVNNSQKDSCFISTSYDATTHFESTVQDVLSMYRKITGKELDLSVDLSAASAAAEE
ncbi:hypothetical protein KFK09_006609 [Dendrobium nobile]|uniref:Guanosine nucleotide diphosphate dissociation inhibitor n=1 Tax=Dendrobium nobile TaxID=94219 RepID=A0A8T3BU09_DENNO|nr:hypothetical protein KFK09_006609 [Dendrobium nobile]